jgi:hypothetical protein
MDMALGQLLDGSLAAGVGTRQFTCFGLMRAHLWRYDVCLEDGVDLVLELVI